MLSTKGLGHRSLTHRRSITSYHHPNHHNTAPQLKPIVTNRNSQRVSFCSLALSEFGNWNVFFFDSSEGGDFSSDTWPLSHGGGRGGLLSFKPGTTYTSVAHNLATILSRQLKKSQLYFNLDNQHNSTYLLVDDK